MFENVCCKLVKKKSLDLVPISSNDTFVQEGVVYLDSFSRRVLSKDTSKFNACREEKDNLQ